MNSISLQHFNCVLSHVVRRLTQQSGQIIEKKWNLQTWHKYTSGLLIMTDIINIIWHIGYALGVFSARKEKGDILGIWNLKQKSRSWKPHINTFRELLIITLISKVVKDPLRLHFGVIEVNNVRYDKPILQSRKWKPHTNILWMLLIRYAFRKSYEMYQ